MIEIERKWLCDINPDSLKNGIYIEDLYISDKVRIRKQDKNEHWIVTIKGSGTLKRSEYEFPIFVKPEFSIRPIRKTRYIINFKNQNFEVNKFHDILYKGYSLLLAELELREENQPIQLPTWIKQEVTEDEKFYGYNLSKFIQYSDFKLV